MEKAKIRTSIKYKPLSGLKSNLVHDYVPEICPKFAGLPWIWISMDISIDISMDISMCGYET